MKYNNALRGWLCLDKPAGVSSNFAMQKVRRVFRENTGYIGTLDPFATGVLPIAVGEARKFIQYIDKVEKVYTCTIKFGCRTDTLDSTGAILDTNDHVPSYTDIEAVIPDYLGEIVQIPPIYSAVKICGVRACDKAREGQIFEMPKKRVVINSIKIINDDLKKKEISLEVSCSRGTYIRTLAVDIANKLGAIAYVKELRRVKSGFFRIKQSISLEKLLKMKDTVELTGVLYPLESPLDDIPALYLTEKEAIMLVHGLCVHVDDFASAVSLVKLFDGNRFIGVGQLDKDGCVKPVRMCIDEASKGVKDVDNK